MLDHAALALGRPPGTGRPRPREMTSARQVQARLLPRAFPHLATLAGHAAYLPARGISGDYYDFVTPAEGRRVRLVMGDVSGKGVPAALMMASLQAALRSHASHADPDLARQLAAVNALFVECTAPQHYTTLFVGEYDDDARLLRYANCGHLPPLLHRPGRGSVLLETTAPVVGLLDEWACDVAEVPLEAGDTLVLYTDGVTEASSRTGELFEAGRLERSIERHAHEALPDLVDSVIADVLRFTDGRMTDDLTLVAVRALPRRRKGERN